MVIVSTGYVNSRDPKTRVMNKTKLKIQDNGRIDRPIHYLDKLSWGLDKLYRHPLAQIVQGLAQIARVPAQIVQGLAQIARVPAQIVQGLAQIARVPAQIVQVPAQIARVPAQFVQLNISRRETRDNIEITDSYKPFKP